MTHPPDGGAHAPALTTTSGYALPTTYGGWFGPSAVEAAERDRFTAQARETDAGRQLQRRFSRWTRLLDHVRLSALTALAANRPVDPNDRDTRSSPAPHRARCATASQPEGSCCLAPVATDEEPDDDPHRTP